MRHCARAFVPPAVFMLDPRYKRTRLPLQVFVGLGFPYEGPAPIEAIALGCVFLQPRLHPPHSADNNNFYKGKPTSRKVNDTQI